MDITLRSGIKSNRLKTFGVVFTRFHLTILDVIMFVCGSFTICLVQIILAGGAKTRLPLIDRCFDSQPNGIERIG
jgi:hypothetical protein